MPDDNEVAGAIEGGGSILLIRRRVGVDLKLGSHELAVRHRHGPEQPKGRPTGQGVMPSLMPIGHGSDANTSLGSAHGSIHSETR